MIPLEESRGGKAPGEAVAGSGLPRRGRGLFRSHLLPRTGRGWVAVISFLVLFALVEPPFVYSVANRIQPWVLGLPFLYAYLLVVYTGLIGVLLWALRGRL